MASDRELCLDAGMNDHIAKPIDPDQLFGVLLRWIKRPDGDGSSVLARTPRPQPPTAARATAASISTASTCARR